MTEADLIRRLDETLARNSEALDRSSASIARAEAAMAEKIDDISDQLKALTAAILQLIDRLGPAEPATS